jgi:hypothetical protein
MQPYVIKQGDYLALLAYNFGFDAATVWNDPANAALRQLRPDPNLLWPTDILYIPDQVYKQPTTQSLQTGTTNNFVSDLPEVPVSLRFVDPPLASQAFIVQEQPQLTGLTTGADGTVTFSIPVTLQAFTVAFTDSGTTFVFNTGHLDPIDTLTGVFQRLQNLGYIGAGATMVPSPDLNVVRDALRAFKAAQPGGSTAPAASSPASDGDPPPPSGPTSSQPSSSPPSDSQPPPSSGPASSPGGSSPPPSDANPSPSSGPASSPPNSSPPSSEPSPPPSSPPASTPPDSAPPSAPPPSSSNSASSPQDNAGLDENGQLDDATSKQLVAAHGS